MLASYLDESSDKRTESLLCVGGLISNEPILRRLSTAWNARLDQDGIAYFRFSDWKNLHGAFHHFRRHKDGARKRADKVLCDLEEILLSESWVGVGMGVLVPQYRTVLMENPYARLLYPNDPTEPAYGQMFYQIAHVIRKNGAGHQVAIFVDKSNDYPKLAGVYRALQLHHPTLGKSLATIAPVDDKLTPAMQMADFIVGKIRDGVAKLVSDPQYLVGQDWSDQFMYESRILASGPVRTC